MKVKDLIKKLEECDPEACVIVDTYQSNTREMNTIRKGTTNDCHNSFLEESFECTSFKHKAVLLFHDPSAGG